MSDSDWGVGERPGVALAADAERVYFDMTDATGPIHDPLGLASHEEVASLIGRLVAARREDPTGSDAFDIVEQFVGEFTTGERDPGGLRIVVGQLVDALARSGWSEADG